MSLIDALNDERESSRKGPACSMCLLLDTMPDDEHKAALLDALADNSISGEGIARALTRVGHRIQGQTVQRHRRRRCSGPV